MTFTTEDGLASDQVCSILEDWEGDLWFGTFGGVSRYQDHHISTLTMEDGLVNNSVCCGIQDREGYLWFGTWEGVSRYDPSPIKSGTSSGGTGEQFVTFTTEDGLVDNNVWSILEDREGNLWFGTRGGVSRYDPSARSGGTPSASSGGTGERFVTFTTEDGLVDNNVRCVLEDRNGRLWFGTARVGAGGYLWAGGSGGGVSRYDAHRPDGEQFINFTLQDEFSNDVRCILEDRNGHLWFGTGGGGVSWYDGERFVNFTKDDGLGGNGVSRILEDREGVLWIGTWNGRVSRYDPSTGSGGPPSPIQSGTSSGETEATFLIFTLHHGHMPVASMMQDRAEHLWFGTLGGGIHRYDGLVWQTLSERDGLADDTVREILQDRKGDIWIATQGGITRYRPRHTAPRIRITDVIPDQGFGPEGEIHVSTSQPYLAFEFVGRSLYTPRDRMAYMVRLEGYEEAWQPTREQRVNYTDLPVGEYLFQVKAVDGDLNYSEPAEVRIIVEPDPRLEALTEALSESGPAGEFVGESHALRQVQKQLAEVASTEVTVLILGETGTGKGLAARTLHEWSTRAGGPFIQVHCGAIPEALVESELFGHERGAFTGAFSRKLGKVELAEGGTLFLDEIGDMPLPAQVKLLRVLEERTFERVGGTETLQADVRIVAATNRDLQGMVEAGEFRGDLYYRLRVFPVQVPPLRERREDIPLLAVYFMHRMAAHLHKERITHFTSEALSMLQAYDWPGNVRELEHAVQCAVIVCSQSAIRAEDLALGSGGVEAAPAEELLTLEAFERRYIRRVLEQTGWRIRGPDGARAVLGLHEATLRSRMKKLGIRRTDA